MYTAVSTTILIQLRDINIGSLPALEPLHLAARQLGFTYAHAQIWLLVLLVSACLRRQEGHPAVTPWPTGGAPV